MSADTSRESVERVANTMAAQNFSADAADLLLALLEERDALAAAMPSEGADAALAYAVEKTRAEKAEAELARVREALGAPVGEVSAPSGTLPYAHFVRWVDVGTLPPGTKLYAVPDAAIDAAKGKT